ncbi:hypothetical protein [Streptomyces sp. NBC_01465]|uniref:hypothetical protein n=1 Tax=Streptomyces sp. NBC_01465 TaxID=2903878 RepID=UPI002E2EF3A2|nr:hypothetical protein [Streptomyces sp. NBC_01465]
MTTTRARAHSTGSTLLSGGGADLRPPGSARSMGVLLILLSMALAVGCYAAFAWWLPSDRERYQDYRAAAACTSRAGEQEQKDCLSTFHFTVEKTVNKSEGKTSTYEATLTGQDSWRGTVSFGDPGPLLKRLAPGDRVTATVWRRDIVVLSKDGVRQNTSEAPRGEIQMNAAFGVLAALVAAQAFVFGAARLAGSRGGYGRLTWDPYGRRLLITIFAAGFGLGLPATWLRLPWWTVPVTVPLVVCAVGTVLYRRTRRPAAR